MREDTCTEDAGTLLEFMRRLGQAYLASGEQTALVEAFLRRVASANGARHCRVVAFPTAIFVTLHAGELERVTLDEGSTRSLRLDQIARVYELGEQAQLGVLKPREGLARLAETLQSKARFGMAGVLAGHVILAVGVALVLRPAAENLAAAAVLGVVVATLKAVSRNRRVLDAPLSVVAAALVSALVFMGLKYGLPVDPGFALIPPLVTFLPGAMLTFGMVELAYGDMVSGTSRLITGAVQLVLLAFGLTAGAVLIGYQPAQLADEGQAPLAMLPERLAPWLGVLVFGSGVYLTFSAPRRSFGWLVLVLVLTYAAQQLGARSFGYEISGFFGTLIATPLGYLIQKRFKGPPSMVTFLPSFWLLVPGALGLTGVKQLLGNPPRFDGLISTTFALASIALGTLVGASLYKSLSESYEWVRHRVGKAEGRSPYGPSS